MYGKAVYMGSGVALLHLGTTLLQLTLCLVLWEPVPPLSSATALSEGQEIHAEAQDVPHERSHASLRSGHSA